MSELIETALAVDQHTKSVVQGIPRQAVLFRHVLNRQSASPKILGILTSCGRIKTLHQFQIARPIMPELTKESSEQLL